jgi:hypothetical protein
MTPARLCFFILTLLLALASVGARASDTEAMTQDHCATIAFTQAHAGATDAGSLDASHPHCSKFQAGSCCQVLSLPMTLAPLAPIQSSTPVFTLIPAPHVSSTLAGIWRPPQLG